MRRAACDHCEPLRRRRRITVPLNRTRRGVLAVLRWAGLWWPCAACARSTARCHGCMLPRVHVAMGACCHGDVLRC
jgi:hypothetical protein